MKKLVIFDWDGTLMDSVSRIVSCMQDAAIAVGVPAPSYDEVKNIIGLSLTVAVEKLFPNATLEQLEELGEQYRYQYKEVNETPSPLFYGALDLLMALKGAGFKLAVATGKAQEGLDRVLDVTGTKALFVTTRCGCDAKSKPHPEMLQSIIEELGMLPEHAVMIGDTSYDLEMAKNAGIESIGVTMGVHSESKLRQYSPSAVVHSLKELKALLLGSDFQAH